MRLTERSDKGLRWQEHREKASHVADVADHGFHIKAWRMSERACCKSIDGSVAMAKSFTKRRGSGQADTSSN